jgi:glycosyltransferase involved in cell wall biosynthesis
MGKSECNTMVSVIVPCQNEYTYIAGFLDSVLAQKFTKGAFEVIISDGLSDDGTRDLLEVYRLKYPQIRIIDNELKIVSTGLNAAIKAAIGDIIIRMDVHTEYAPDYIEQCVSALEITCADNVGGPARTKANSFMQQAIRLAYHSPFSVGGARFHIINYEGYVDTVTYGCWKKSTLERIGLFDEELVRNQDDELNLRLIRSGGRIWQSPLIISWYYPRASLSELFKQYMQYGYWKVRVIQKHKAPASLRHLVPGGFVGTLIMLALFSPFNSMVFKLLIGLFSLYVLVNIMASVITCRKPPNIKYLLVMPFVFATYHFGYGCGFIRGMVDFAILRKAGSKVFSQITRKRNVKI